MRRLLTICVILILPILAYAAAANGFITVSPDARYGDAVSAMIADSTFASKFTMGGSGTCTISEIGAYLDGDTAARIHFAIFTDDAGNGCPEATVANSDTGEIDPSADISTKDYYSYGTKPELTGGANYWIGVINGNASTTLSRFDSGGTGVYFSGSTSYPTFPTGDGWHAATSATRDWSFYAVYNCGSSGTSRMMLLGVGD